MSQPIEQRLGQLSINTDMPPHTRSQSHNIAEDDDEFGTHSSEFSDPEPYLNRRPHDFQPTATVSSRVRTYDNRFLPETLWTRAQRGLKEDYDISARIKPASRKTEPLFSSDVYQFRLTEIDNGSDIDNSDDDIEDVILQIGKPSQDSYARLEMTTCDCDDWSRGSPCKHVFFLLDRILDYEDEPSFDGTYPLDLTGSALRLSTPFVQLQLRGLGYLAERGILNYEPRPTDPGTPDSSAIAVRRRVVNDILSTFHPTDLPEEFHPNLFNAVTEDSIPGLGGSKNGNTIGSVLFHLAVTSTETFSALRRIIRKETCDNIFFTKINQKISSTLASFDEFIKHGPAKGSSHQNHDLDWCSSEIQRYTEMIAENLRSRAPMTRKAKEMAVNVLVSILLKIVERNKDAYSKIDWPRDRPENETAPQRNLFLRLVTTSSSAPSSTLSSSSRISPKGQPNSFILDNLWGLTDIASTALASLNEVLNDLKNPGTRGKHPAPVAYVAQLERLINHITRGIPGEVSVAGLKRGPETEGRASPSTDPSAGDKRRKK
jgi:hypothetical protein